MDAQAILWALPSKLGSNWSTIQALVALPTSFLLFWYLIRRHAFSALLVARALWLGGLICVIFAPLNSGWTPWATLFFVLSSLLTTILLVTNWCERENKNENMAQAVWRKSKSLVNLMTGPYCSWSPDDTWRKMYGVDADNRTGTPTSD